MTGEENVLPLAKFSLEVPVSVKVNVLVVSSRLKFRNNKEPLEKPEPPSILSVCPTVTVQLPVAFPN